MPRQWLPRPRPESFRPGWVRTRCGSRTSPNVPPAPSRFTLRSLRPDRALWTRRPGFTAITGSALRTNWPLGPLRALRSRRTDRARRAGLAGRSGGPWGPAAGSLHPASANDVAARKVETIRYRRIGNPSHAADCAYPANAVKTMPSRSPTSLRSVVPLENNIGGIHKMLVQPQARQTFPHQAGERRLADLGRTLQVVANRRMTGTAGNEVARSPF